MSEYADKMHKDENVPHRSFEQQNNSDSTAQLSENSPNAILQREQQEAVNNSPKVQQLKTYQKMADNSPHVQQFKAYQEMANKSPRVQQFKAFQEMVDNSPRVQQFKAYQEMADNSPRMQQFKALQEMADNSPRVQQFKAYQEMADNYTPNNMVQRNEHAGDNPSTSSTEKKEDKNSNTANISNFVSPEGVKHFQESLKTNSTSSPQTGLNIANPATQMGTDLKASVQINKKIPLADPRASNIEKASFHVNNKTPANTGVSAIKKPAESMEQFKDWLGIITYGQHNKGESNVTAEHTTWMESTLLEMLELFISNLEFSKVDSRTETIKEAVEAVNKALEQAGKEGYIKYDYSDKTKEDTVIKRRTHRLDLGIGTLEDIVEITDESGKKRTDTIIHK